jgi:hypothetical protein
MYVAENTQAAVHRQTRICQRFLTNSAETIDMANPTKKIHATRSGTGLLTTTRNAMMIPAINMIISPTFVALLKSFITYLHKGVFSRDHSEIFTNNTPGSSEAL